MLHHLASFRFLFIALVMLVLAVLAAVVGTDDYARRQSQYEARIEQNRTALENVNVYSFLQPLVGREPEPLSVLSRGFEGRLGSEVRLSVFVIPAAAAANGHDNELMAWSRDLDLTMIVRLVLGLLALLLTFDAVVR